MSSPTVAVLGDVNIDLLLDVPNFPEPGGDAVAHSQRLQLGGSATNTAVELARLGARVRLAARVGGDPNGGLAASALAAEGIALDDVSTDPQEPTSLNVVVVTPDGERTMYAYRGANARLSPEHLRPELVAGASALHLSGYALLADPQRAAARQAIGWAKQASIPIILDVPVAGANHARDEILRLLPDLTLITVGETELRTLAGPPDIDRAIETLAGLTGAAIAVKLGRRGSCSYRGTDRTEVPALQVDPIDTTGAGDAFAAGLVYGLTCGLDEVATLVLANTLGGLATTRRGAGPALPTVAEVIRALSCEWAGTPELAAGAGRAATSIQLPIAQGGPDDPR